MDTSTTAVSRVLCVLTLQPASHSLSCAPDEAANWHWLLERVRRACGSLTFRAVVFDGAEPAEFRFGTDVTDVPMHVTRCGSELAALNELLSSGMWDTVVYLRLECAFAPDASLQSLLLAHAQNQSWLTTFLGLPESVSPCVVSRRVIDLAAGISGLLPGGNSLPVTSLFRKCVEVARHTEHPEAAACDVPMWGDEATRPRMPATLNLRTPRSRERLNRLRRDMPDADGTALLVRWRDDDDEVQRLSRLTAWMIPASGPTRVLFVSNPSAFSGSESALCATIQGLAGLCGELTALVALEGHFAEQLRALGIKVVVAGEDLNSLNADTAKMAAAVLSQSDPHIVHFNGFSGPIVGHFARLRGCRLVYHLRVANVSPLVAHLQECDSVIAVSEFVKKRAVTAGVLSDKVEVVYDGVDTATWVPVTEAERSDAKRQLGIDPSLVTVLMIGRYAENKRQDLLVSALASLPNRDRIQLLLVGESYGSFEWERHIDQIIAECELTSRVTKLGFQKEIRQVEVAADISVLCSEDEPLGMAILEAMSMAIPVVVSDDSGLSELVTPDCGFVVKPGVQSLAAVLAELSANSTLRSELGRRGRHVCLQRCKAQDCASSIEKIYRRLRASRSGDALVGGTVA